MRKNLFLLLVSLLFGGFIYAQDNHWTPIDGAFQGQNRLSFIATVTIDEEPQTSQDIEIAMFIDDGETDECYSSVRIEELFSGSGIYVANPICNYDNAGSTVRFKLYNHSTEEELDNCSYSYTTTEYPATIGLNNPIELPFTHETSQTYVITISANPEGWGTVTGGGTHNEGEEITVVATAEGGYEFVNWTEDEEEVSTNASYTFTVERDRTLVANFVESTPAEPVYPWVIEQNSQFNGTVVLIATVQINGVTIEDPDRWDVGAFCNNNYRTSQLIWVYDDEYQFITMDIEGLNGDLISFKLYDKENNEYHGVCDYVLTFDPTQNYGMVGDVDDPIPLNFVYSESFELPITGYGEGDNYFYLIATPIGQVAPTNVDQMLSNEYDLFYFDQSSEDGLEWINYKHPEHGSFDLVPGKGYLYANSQDVTLTFTGAPYAAMSEVTLYKDDNAEFAGWNLIGNPYGQTAYIDKAYYKMNDDGSAVVAVDGYSLAPMEGAFVIADEDGETLVFSTEETNNNGGKLVFNLGCNRGVTLDRTIINFENNHTLPKFELNENTTKLYIPQSDDDYAVVAADSEMEELPLNFKAAENGTYTLTMFKNLDMQYLRLVDQKTGTVVDLLANPVYTFDANSTDYANRFMLQFKANSNVNTNETMSPIQYLNNGQLSIIGLEGDSELQVIDMLGRILSSTTFNGDYNQMLTVTPGVYMIRLTNSESTYTQKIVVK